MAYKFARFVIHYRDGSTYVEDRNDPYSWDNRPKKPISALAILPDPVKAVIEDKENNRKIPIKIDMNEYTLKGSFKRDFQFFQMKHAALEVRAGAKSKTHALTIGMVVNNKGDCVCMTLRRGYPYVYFTNVFSLQLNLELFDIKLEELPENGQE